MMGQASDKCRGHAFIIQNVDPLGEFKVRVKYHGFLLMDLRQVIEQDLGPGAVIRHVSEFIEYQDLCGAKLLFQSSKIPFGFAFREEIDKSCSAVKLYRDTCVAGGNPYQSGKHCFSGTSASVKNKVFPLVVEFQPQQGVQGYPRWKIDLIGPELFPAVHLREAGSIEELCPPPLVSVCDLIAQKVVQVFLVCVSFLGHCPFREIRGYFQPLAA